MESTLSLGAVPKKYDEAFKRQAVEMVLHGGRSVKEVANDLGVSQYSIYEWKRKFFSSGSSIRPAIGVGQEGALPADIEELKRLALKQQQRLEEQQRQIVDLVQQREILKKTLGIVCEKPSGASNGLKQ